MTLLTWIGIGLCLTQSAMFSGSNLAFFSISKLRLELEVGKNDKHAIRVLALREDSNFLLVTILWGNVAVNVSPSSFALSPTDYFERWANHPGQGCSTTQG